MEDSYDDFDFAVPKKWASMERNDYVENPRNITYDNIDVDELDYDIKVELKAISEIKKTFIDAVKFSGTNGKQMDGPALKREIEKIIDKTVKSNGDFFEDHPGVEK
jgi:hypothetical protein